MTVRVGYLRAPIPASGYYFPRTTSRGPQRTRRSGFALAPNYRFLGRLADAGSAAVPAGTVLAYSATWKDSKLQINTPDAVQAQIQGTLASKWGIVIDSQSHSQSDFFNLSGTQSMTLQIHVTSDYGLPTDVQSIIDGLIYQVTNAQVAQGMPQSTIRIVSAAFAGAPTAQLPASTAAALASAQAGYQDAVSRGDQVSAAQFAAQIQSLTGTNPMGSGAGVTTWFSSNWPWLAVAGIGFAAVKEFL